MTTLPRPRAGRRGPGPLPPGTIRIALTTADGVRLAGLRCAGPPGAAPAGVPSGVPGGVPGGVPSEAPGDAAQTRPRAAAATPAFVIAHGFTQSTSATATRRVIAMFARHGPVVAVDFRGHGGSGGRSSVGRDEHMDLDAAVRAARAGRTGPVAVVGFSLGGAVALRQAAIGAERPDAVVAVSAPSRWYIRSTGPMRRVHWLLEHPAGSLVARAIGVRLGEPWPEVPPTPLELVDRIPPLPLLLVHGDADPYFGVSQACALHRAAGGGGPLWIEPGMGHAETATAPRLADRIAAWVRDVTQGP